MCNQSTDFLEIPAHVEADPSHVVHIFPPLSGRMLGLRVLPGQEVKKGDVVAQLQSSDIAAARSDFQKAKIEVLRTDRALTRGKLLLDHEVLSQADYYELEAADQTAHSELDRARQRIRELGFSEDSTSDEIALRTPISGVVLDIGTATGEMERSLDNATPIATIANIDSVWIVGDVFERDLASLKPGREVQVLVPAYPGTTFTGRIANIGDALDPSTHTLKLRVVLPNPKHTLKTEMFATIRIPGAARNAVILPGDCGSSRRRKDLGLRRQLLRKIRAAPSDHRPQLRLRPDQERRDPHRPQRRREGRHSWRSTPPSHQRRVIACKSLIRLFIRYRAIILILFFVMLAAGGFAFSRLDIEAYPDPSPPMVEFITQNPSWSAEEMEQQVTFPVETTLNGTPHLTRSARSLFSGSPTSSFTSISTPTTSSIGRRRSIACRRFSSQRPSAAALTRIAGRRDLSLSAHRTQLQSQ